MVCRGLLACGSQTLGESVTVLHEVVRLGDVDLTRMMLAARAAVNTQEVKGGLSPLHIAARAKHHDIIQLLLEANAD